MTGERPARWKKGPLGLGAIALALAAGIFLGNLFGSRQYWSEDRLDDFSADMERYAASLPQTASQQERLKEQVRQSNLQASPVPDDCRDFFQQCNRLLTNCFQQAYGVDVSQRLALLPVKQSAYSGEAAETVGGAHSEGVIYFNSLLIQQFLQELEAGKVPSATDSDTDIFVLLRHVYLHEAIHYLGFGTANAPGQESFVEALTEALTQQVEAYWQIPYQSVTGYGVIKELGAMVLEADPLLAQEVLRTGSYDIDRHMGQILGEGRLEQLDTFTLLMLRGETALYREIPYLAQYLVNEYAKRTAGDQAQALSHHSVVRLFGLKWLTGWHKTII